MLITCNCSRCNKSIGIVQYTDHYFCKNHFGDYICTDCYNLGNKNCNKCQEKLTFHNSDETKKYQIDNNLLF